MDMTTNTDSIPPAGLVRREYGRLADGRIVEEITLSNGTDLVLTAITLGGIVTKLQVPDREGVAGNVVLGFDNLTDYVERNPHFGVIVGRYANRIARGELQIDGTVYALDRNEGTTCLHGGKRGFGCRLWEVESTQAVDPLLGGP